MKSIMKSVEKGFTLIEVLIVVAIVAILATIALPSYSDYVLRGRLTEATNELSAMSARMEQYYQDNRTYNASGSYTPPCSASWTTTSNWTYSCATGPSTYTLTATGKPGATTSSFTFTLDQAGTKATTAGKWGTSATCWITRAGGTC